MPSAAVRAKRLFGAMSQTDAGWIACLAAKAYRALTSRYPFPNDPPEPRRIAADARIYMLGDWGSGIGRAKKIANRIESMLEAEGARDQHVIHLGDVYYSGWPEEYDEHFLPNWPVRAGKESRYGSWSLNSNHEMFSGGHGYFDHLLKDARFAGQNGQSVFVLQNEDWQFLIDSAWLDEDLAGNQFDGSSNGRPTIRKRSWC